MFRYSPAPSVELYDVASGRTFATLRPPSSSVADVFAEGGKSANKNGLQKSAGASDTHIWEIIQSLAPSAGEPKNSPVDP